MDIEHLLIWSRAKLIRRREVESNCNGEAYAISTGLGTHPSGPRFVLDIGRSFCQQSGEFPPKLMPCVGPADVRSPRPLGAR